MVCTNCTCKLYQKSSSVVYNTATQAYVAAGTALTLTGVQGADTGCSICTGATSFTVKNSGLYYVEFDVTSTPSAAGTQVVQAYLGSGVAVPCMISTITATAASTVTQHIESVLDIPAGTSISVRISGVAGSVTYVKASAFRLA